jgi:DNA-directed RNA polymerase I, II, and III subunit RPABC1
MERLWKINRTLIQKLEDTHYLITDADREAVSTLQLFQASYPTRESMERVFKPIPGTIAESRSPQGLVVVYAELEEDKKHISVEDVRRLIKKMQDTNVITAFFILNASLSSKAADTLRTSQAPGSLRVVVFGDHEMLFNITKHNRVPKHYLLTASESHTWLTEAKLKRSQIPRVFQDDPMVKYIDGLVGDLVKVVRASPTCGVFVHHVTVVRRLGK